MGDAAYTVAFRYSGEPFRPGTAGDAGDFPEVRHDLARIAASVDRDALAAGPASLWRYAPVLPVEDPARAVSLGEGWTPLLAMRRLGAELGLEHLLGKDEGRNPSGTFKDRGASVALSRWRERGHAAFVHHSSGNSGAAWALYAARAGLSCIDLLAPDILPASLQQAGLAGARIFVLDGPWLQAGRIVAEAAARCGWLDVGALREPYRLEGKKTMGYEICEQLGWRLPDAVVYPTGGGLGPIAIYKGFQELIEMGWVARAPLPRLIVAQYEGCAPIVRAFLAGAARAEPWDALAVPPGGLKSARPPGDRGVLALLRETGGTAVTVATDEALAAVRQAAALEGVFVAPESATTIVAAAKALAGGTIGRDDEVVLLLTGSGLKSVPIMRPPAVARVADAEQMVTAPGPQGTVHA